MDLKEVQISEIKNLKLIYVFTTDSIFKNESNKYVGAKVVFDKNKTFSLDYSDKYFPLFIKKILERYQKEKDKRKIILLGDLTKKLINNSSFAILEKNQTKKTKKIGLPSYNTNDNEIKKYESFLKETLEMILNIYKKYEVLEINNITGFNNKYILDYSIGSIKKQTPLIINKIEEGLLEFRLSYIDGSKVGVSGTLNHDGGNVNINWHSNDEKLQGSIIYDSLNKTVERKITSEGKTIIYDENKDSILEEDMSLIKFYFDLVGLIIPKNILKTSYNSFLLSDEMTLNDDEQEILYSDIGTLLTINENEIRIKNCVKNCFSKYDNQINTVLDEENEEFILRKIEVEDKKGVLIEQKTTASNQDESYSHEFIEVTEDFTLNKIFNIEKRYIINQELKTLEKAKQYIKQNKRGNK